jgi:ABC-2 type transport system permease protein
VNKTLIIFRHELLVTFKRTSFILVTLAIPVLMLVGYGIYQGVQHWYHPSEAETKTIGYVDQAGGFDKYTNLGATFVRYPVEEDAKQALLSREISEYFVIPSDYLRTGQILRYTMQRELEPPSQTMESIKEFLISNLIGSKTSTDVLKRAKTPIVLTSARLDQSGEMMGDQNPFVQFFMPYIFAILLMFSIFFASGYLLQSISEEKENRLMEVLLSSVSARQLLVGKVLGLGAAGLAQIALWVISFWVFVDIALVNIPGLSDLSVTPSVLILALIYYILGYLLFAVLMAVLGSIGTTARESQSWSSIVALTATLPMFFLNVIIENPNHAISVVFTLIPTTSSVTAMMRLPTEGIPAWQLGLSLVLLVATIVFCMWAGAKVFRACLLMYGKRPSLMEITKYIREA